MRRWGAATAAVLMLVFGTAACGHGKAKDAGPQSYGDPSMLGGRAGSGPPASTTVAPLGGAGVAHPSGGGRSAPLTTPTVKSSSGGGPAAPSSGPAASGSPSSAERQIAATASGPVGSFARTLLQRQPATSIVVEVIAQEGASPRPATTQHLTSMLTDVSGKTVSVQTTPLNGSAQSWSDDAIHSTADQHTRFRQGDNGVAVLHLLYVHGDYHGDQSVLGVADRGDVLAIFVDQLQSASTVAVPERVLEDAVTIHETGHILGLVDLVLHTGRQDPQHPGHSPNKDSVMYWAVDTDLVGQLLQGGPSTNFDDADRQDLATIRNGA